MTAKASLLKNTIFLYLLTFSNYLFGFITVPYLSRILGPEVFGELGFSMAFYTYFSLVLDFGFLLYGTKIVAENNQSSSALSKILANITYSKFIVFIVLLILTLGIVNIVPRLYSCRLLIILYLLAALFNGLMPDFIYRGLEDMKIVTIRTVLLKLVATSFTFILVKNVHDINYVPLCQIIGGVSALVFVFIHLKKEYNIRLARPSLAYAFSLMKESIPFFLSRIASSIYGITNTLVLGFIYTTGPVLGYYNSTEKVKALATQAFFPISDSFFPYMLRTRDYKNLFKVTIALEILVVTCCAIIWIFSEQICCIIFGPEYINAADMLRYQLPLIAIIFLSCMFGFPALSPIKKDKWANASVICAMINQILGISILLIINKFNVYSMLIVTYISELICLFVRLLAISNYYYQKKHW